MQFWIPVWSKAPFIRLLAALVAGIALQWQLQFPAYLLSILTIIAGLLLITYQLLNVAWRFRLRVANGAVLYTLMAVLGAFSIWAKDIRNDKQWFGHQYPDTSVLVLRLEEPLVEKPNSFKAQASVVGRYYANQLHPAEGRAIVYFKKDSSLAQLSYGTIITTGKPLQAIRNAGNPGGFDYQRYCLFQGITHQLYLTPGDFTTTGLKQPTAFRQFIFNCRTWVLAVLQKYVAGEKEVGLAQALLIGYKDDLDKNLAQSYTNTGVVHVIAISGLHLGLIYWLLVLLTRFIAQKRWSRWIRLTLILAGLWIFSFLAGAQASVIRSAVMFSVMATGETLSKRSSTINTLALSAFALLCFNPFWLWDVGFQLSYAAVLSIVLFFQPIYHCLDFENKAIDFVWKLIAVTLSAQILTLPLSIFHFHQVPILFLLTNLVAVPLSSIILLGEILLCAFSILPFVARVLGLVLRQLIEWMNSYVEQVDGVSFAVWDGLSINLLQFFLMTAFALAFSFWWMEKKKALLWTAAICCLVFLSLRSYSFIHAQQQQKMIVYNVPKRKAIDIISGRNCSFVGDKDLMTDEFARNFHIQPSRVLHRIDSMNVENFSIRKFDFAGKRVLLLDDTGDLPLIPQQVDILILSKSPKLYINELFKSINTRQIVIDSSVPRWKARLWKKDAAALGIPCHDVSEQGAYVLEI